MKALRLRHSPMDIAPHAPQHRPAAWLVLAAGLLVFIVCSWIVGTQLLAYQQAQRTLTQLRAEQTAKADAARKLQQRSRGPVDAEAAKTQQRLQQLLRLSWIDILDVLEAAARDVRSGVTLLSLASSGEQGAATQIQMTALAASPTVMLEYVRALRKDRRMVQAELSFHEPDEAAGAGAVRFDLVLSWDASAAAPASGAAQ